MWRTCAVTSEWSPLPHAVASGLSSRMMAARFAALSMKFVNTNLHWIAPQPTKSGWRNASFARINPRKGAFFFCTLSNFLLDSIRGGGRGLRDSTYTYYTYTYIVNNFLILILVSL